MSRVSQIPSVSIASHVAGRKVFDLVVPALDETYKATRRVGSSGGLAHGHVLADIVELVGALCARTRVQNNYVSNPNPCHRQHAAFTLSASWCHVHWSAHLWATVASSLLHFSSNMSPAEGCPPPTPCMKLRDRQQMKKHDLKMKPD